MLGIAFYLPGFQLATPLSAFVAAFAFGVVHTIVGPILFLLTLPFTILTLGLFLVVLNALLLALVDFLVPGLTIHGVPTLVIASLVLAVVSMIWKGASKMFDK